MLNLQQKDIRYRERYAGRRIEDKAVFGGELTHPYTRDLNTGTINYEQLPLMSESVLDFGQFLNRLNIRRKDGKLIGQTANREDALTHLSPVTFMDQGSVLAPSTKLAWTAKETMHYQPASSAASISGEQASGIAATAWTLLDTSVNLSKNALAQALITGRVRVGRNSTDEATLGWKPVTSEAVDSYGSASVASEDVIADMPGDGTAASWASYLKTPEGAIYNTGLANPRVADYVGLTSIHSSALSFIFQWQKELINLASQTQYLSSELVGFYEKGLKGDFLRHYSDAEVALMINLVELGAALRRQALVQNMSDDTETGYTGTANMFFTYLQGCYEMDDAGTPVYTAIDRMYTPWWLTLAIDKYHFEHNEDIDDVRDIHREDLFHAIKVLFEAASFEYGMLVKSTGTPYLDFFTDFEKADLYDYTVKDDVKTLRSLWMAGFESAEQYIDRDAPSGSFGWSLFQDFIQSGQIVQTERLDLMRDYAELETLPWITGSYVNAGAAFIGAFEHSVHHRLTRFGSKSLDVKHIPYVLYRTLEYPAVRNATWTAAIDGTNDIQIDGNAETGRDSIQAFWADAVDSAVSSHAVKWIAFPSIKMGWTSFGHNVMHPSSNAVTGYGSVKVGKITYGPFGESKTMFPTLNDVPLLLSDGGTGDAHYSINMGVPLCPRGYWSLGADGMLAGLILKTNEVYKAWSGRTSGLFRRSELKNLLNFQSYNVVRELKMATPDPYFAKYGKEIFGMMNCGATGFDPGIVLRHMDRLLDNPTVHGRTSAGLYGTSTVHTDADIVVSPFFVEASSIEDVFFAQHMLGYLMGQYGPSLLSQRSGAQAPDAILDPDTGDVLGYDLPAMNLFGLEDQITTLGNLDVTSMTTLSFENMGMLGTSASRAHTGRKEVTGGEIYDYELRGNTIVNEWQFYPLGVGPGLHNIGDAFDHLGSTVNMDSIISDDERRSVPVKFSCLRTFYHNFKPLDGAITYVGVTPMIVGNAPIGERSLRSMAEAGLFCPIYNFRTETVGRVGQSNGTTYDLLPGHMEMFKVWKLFETHSSGAAAADTVLDEVEAVHPSLCHNFGNDSTPTITGSTVPALKGFSGAIPALGMNTGFSNEDYLTYLEGRSGDIATEPEDIRRWREAAPKLLLYDMDVCDTSEGMLGALLYLIDSITHPGQVTYVAILGADGSVDYEIRDSYGWGGGTKSIETGEAYAEESATGDSDSPVDSV